MSNSNIKLISKMCSQLWTANVLTLAQLLLLLFVGTCFSNVTVTTNTQTTKFLNKNNISTSPLLTKILNSTITSRTIEISANTIATSTEGLSKKTTKDKHETTTSFSNIKISERTKDNVTKDSTFRVIVKNVFKTKSRQDVVPVADAITKIHEKIDVTDCDLPILPKESRLWRGNETHELNLPITMTEDCLTSVGGSATTGAVEEECPPVIVSWEGSADIQSGDILIVRIADSALLDSFVITDTTQMSLKANVSNNNDDGERIHRTPLQPAVYQVTRQGHEHCDVTDGMLLDIAPLVELDAKFITLYDKDLTEGVNLLIVVSENWGSKCVRLKVTVKSDNCGESQDCSGKGVCYTNVSMEGYECQCCPTYVGPHCEEQDACNPSPCLNNGICVDLTQPMNGANYQCLCPYGYSGRNCNIKADPCNSSPCENGGTCIGSQNNTVYQCACPESWTGARCERPKMSGACASQPCINGICIEQSEVEIEQGSGEYRCFCQPGYAGTQCEYEYNECESSPCANGGTCTDRVGGFQCACGRGFTGRTCQLKVDLCSPNSCPPHRFCIDRGNSYACECPRGFVGDECNIQARAACDNNPCAHGGTCWNGVDSFYCACRPGYTGRLCEEDFVLESVMAGEEGARVSEVEEHTGGGSVREVRLPLGLYHDRLHNVYIAAGTLGAAIAIVGIVVTACHCRVNKTYTRFLSRVSRVAEGGGQAQHWLQDKRAAAPAHAPHAHSPYAAAALDTADMYYTLDFSDNQSSPLIQ